MGARGEQHRGTRAGHPVIIVEQAPPQDEHEPDRERRKHGNDEEDGVAAGDRGSRHDQGKAGTADRHRGERRHPRRHEAGGREHGGRRARKNLRQRTRQYEPAVRERLRLEHVTRRVRAPGGVGVPGDRKDQHAGRRRARDPRRQPVAIAAQEAHGAPKLGARQKQPRRREQDDPDEQRPDGIAR